MKPFMIVVVAAVSGAVGGSMISFNAVRAQDAPIAPIRTTELIVVDENGKPAAVLNSANGRLALRLFIVNSKPAIEIGVDRRDGTRFIHLLGDTGRVVAGLNSLRPNGESTLVLGDERWDGRIAVGALRTDTDYGQSAIDDWGLVFRGPTSMRPLASVLIHSAGDKSTARFNVVRPNGTTWTPP